MISIDDVCAKESRALDRLDMRIDKIDEERAELLEKMRNKSETIYQYIALHYGLGVERKQLLEVGFITEHYSYICSKLVSKAGKKEVQARMRRLMWSPSEEELEEFPKFFEGIDAHKINSLRSGRKYKEKGYTSYVELPEVLPSRADVMIALNDPENFRDEEGEWILNGGVI